MHNEIVKKGKDIYESTKEQETVIFNARTGEFLGLQDTSEIIWKMIDGTRNKDMIVNDLLILYENESRMRIEHDVDEMLDILKRKGVIV